MDIARSLSDLRDRVGRAREELRIVEEQMLFQLDVVEEARTRMLTSETPLAERHYRAARDDYERLSRQHSRLDRTIAELQREQDRLLDHMLARRP